MTQARAVCHVADREILTVNAALGERPFDRAAQFEADATARCPARRTARRGRCAPTGGTINARLDQRVAQGRDLDGLDGTPGDGRTVLWSRIPEVLDGVDGAALAVLGDFVPMGVGQALGVRGGGNSLDNTLRIVDLVPTDWVLLDIRVHAVERGSGTGSCTCSPRTARCWRRPARVASCATGADRSPVATAARAPSARHVVNMTLPVRPGMTVPLPGPLHTHRGQARRARRSRLHRHLVVRGRRRRRLHPAGPGRGVGAAAAPRHGDRAGLHRGRRPASPRAWRRWPTPRPGASPSASGRRAT